jgi:hypothetical protein
MTPQGIVLLANGAAAVVMGTSLALTQLRITWLNRYPRVAA